MNLLFRIDSLLDGERLAPLRARLRAQHRLLIGTIATLAFVVWSGAGAAAWFSYDVAANLPGPHAIADIGDMAQATTIHDASNRPLFTIFKEQRMEIPLAKVSPHLIRAIIAIEDQRFFEHRGIDAVRVVGSVVANLREGRRAQGGSTITQQLARLSFLSRDKTYRRKLKEVILAARIERAYSKEDILELYLNKVYFGDGLYGAEAAARGFFGKPAADLDVAEAALLAGIIKSPSTWAPTVNLERAIARRSIVLQAMLDSGAIQRAVYERARHAPVRLRSALQRDEPFGLYVKEQVRRELVERFGWERVYQGGLRVYTSIDPQLQRAAEEVVEKGLSAIEKRSGYLHQSRDERIAAGGAAATDYLQGALVALNPVTGEVLAMVGGRDFKESRFNRAVQAKRQPGSAFKPFVFAAALENGFTPASVIQNLDDPILTAQGHWVPEDEHSSARAMTLRTALRTSSNRAAVQLLRGVGIDKTVAYAQRLSVGTVPSVPSLALGSGEVTLQSMTVAFATFANGGYLRRPVLIRRVEDSDGALWFDAAESPPRVLTEATAFLMANMLADVINAGTAHRARRDGFTLPAAGKTGTTNDFVDAWFIGFTPRVVTGVWIGFDQPRTIVRSGYASELAVPLWADFMKIATRRHSPDWFERPEGVVAVNVCRVSGKRPNEGCSDVEVISDLGEASWRSMVYTEYFARGTEPRDVCPLHAPRSIFDRVAGLFGAGPEPPPARESDLGLPAIAAPAPTAGAPAAAPVPQPTPQPTVTVREEPKKEKKRGFWSRVFGRGKNEKP
jgi:1A family penicillin-binding protein